MAAVLSLWRGITTFSRQPANQSDISQRASQPVTKALPSHGSNIQYLVAGVCTCVWSCLQASAASAAGVGSPQMFAGS